MKSSAKIEVSKASLISLKAELSRKQDEVNKAKLQGSFIHPVPRPKSQTVWTKKNPGVVKRHEKDLEQDKEEEDLLKKSRVVLEAKSKLYDKLSQQSTSDDTFLVDFQQKTAAEVEEKHDSDEYDSPSDPEEDWVDYTDCLGRTRRCLKKDLEYIKEKDTKLFQSLGFEVNQESEKKSETSTSEPLGEPELLSGDMKRELMRQKWEQQEEQLRNKTDIHYQDILFDEARSHGVGYYGFSQDEAQRRTQQESLTKLRKETQREQEATKDARERRRLQMEARLKAARRRKRERMGLPPEEEEIKLNEEPEVVSEQNKSDEEVEKTDSRPPTPKAPIIRPWDLGKEGLKEVMSQEDWVKKKRTERPQEFAPPSTYQPDFIPDPEQEVKPKRSLFFSSKKPSTVTQYEEFYESPQQKIQRMEAPSTFDHCTSSSSSYGRETLDYQIPTSSSRTYVSVEKRDEVAQGRGTEIPPPPTFDYYGPSSSTFKPRKNVAKQKDIESSISAGLKYLRQQAEEREKQREKGLLDIL